MEPQEILKKFKHFAVLGVTSNTDKFGYKIFKRLIDKQYDVYGVSPIYDTVDHYKMYSSLTKIQKPIDVVVFVVNKKYAYDYVDQMHTLGIRYAWMQPNTYDEDLIEYMKLQGIEPIFACVLVET